MGTRNPVHVATQLYRVALISRVISNFSAICKLKFIMKFRTQFRLIFHWPAPSTRRNGEICTEHNRSYNLPNWCLLSHFYYSYFSFIQSLWEDYSFTRNDRHCKLAHWLNSILFFLSLSSSSAIQELVLEQFSDLSSLATPETHHSNNSCSLTPFWVSLCPKLWVFSVWWCPSCCSSPSKKCQHSVIFS